MNKKLMRVLLYLVGTAVLTLGITFLVKANLGVSPISSIPYVLSVVLHIELGNITFIVFCLLVLLQVFMRRKGFKWYDLLQIPFSLLFSKLITLFNTFVSFGDPNMTVRVILVIVGIFLMGIGAGTVLAMRFPPNAGDGFVQTMADVTHIKLGLCKNIFDLSCVAITFLIGMIVTHSPIGIGIGTLVAIIGVGRVIALWQHFSLKKLQTIAGVPERK